MSSYSYFVVEDNKTKKNLNRIILYYTLIANLFLFAAILVVCLFECYLFLLIIFAIFVFNLIVLFFSFKCRISECEYKFKNGSLSIARGNDSIIIDDFEEVVPFDPAGHECCKNNIIMKYAYFNNNIILNNAVFNKKQPNYAFFDGSKLYVLYLDAYMVGLLKNNKKVGVQ